ncbi:DNA phosphorothioation system restriction enzyme [Calothrix sp. NIES-3974]|uniref:DNA phosphorothioation system restriction enzyme n=1 Tax=Calothrix sp. NIES-3974 TaxID=2005462 RepID=UPI000B6061E5|nr:DNA phosphorothioation system restriction enzyme [Calothrix sp. NIES-3974]BAZ06705.1 type III restriction enzyme res subunit [Calothrix sp. NIES-3974]
MYLTQNQPQKVPVFNLKPPFLGETRGFYQVESVTGCPQIPGELELRPYQRQAVTNWFGNNGRGTLKMATGSGKTITALAIACELYQQIQLQVVIIVCPFRHLVAQWGRECQRFNLRPILAFEGVRSWQSELATQLYNVRTDAQRFLAVVTTNQTLLSQGFQSQIPYLPERTLIIGDEVHNLGTPKLEESLPRRIGLRLGLSATPERHYDEEGTQSVFEYFGEVLQPELTLADAIAQQALVPYYYHPLFIQLTPEESRIYAKLTQKIGRILLTRDRDSVSMDDWERSQDLTTLLVQRARLVGVAENKLVALRELMAQRRHTTHTLFYCSDGSPEPGGNLHLRQLQEVTRILGTELGYRVSTYTAETRLRDREILRQQFEQGELQGLVAIRCLDEGVDIPAIQTAVILASSTNPRQFIQRRGRVLRPHPGKDYATIFDMIVMPPELDRQTFEFERNLLKKELRRLIEFANLAVNADTCTSQLIDIHHRYGLGDYLV